MFTFLNILGVFAAILLIFVVTIRRSTDMIEKVTWWLAGIMCLLCVVVAKWTPTVQHAINKQESVINDYVDQATIPAPADAQPFGGNAITPAETPAEPATPAE